METILAPRGGLRYDIPADLIASMEMSDCRNVNFEDGLVKKRYGYSTFGGNVPLAGAVLRHDQFTDFSSNNYLLSVTTKMPYRLASPSSSPYWETIHESEVEDDCETTWTNDMGANGTVSDETTIKKVGSKSQKISPADAFTTGLAAHRDQALGDKSAYSFVRLWIRSSVAQAAGDLQFLIDDTAGCGSPTESLDIPALVADTWKLVFLEASDPSTTMTAIASLGLKINTDNGACNIYIDDIQFVKAFSSNVTDSDYVYSASVHDATQTDPWWVMTNGVDAIKKWTGSGAISNLISSYPSGVTALLAEMLIEFKSYLLLLDVSEDGNRYPQRVRWPDTADPGDYLNGNASYIDLTGEDWIKGAHKVTNDYLAIFKEDSTWLCYATGESDIFDFIQKSPDIGTSSPLSIVSVIVRKQEQVLFLGREKRRLSNVYAFNGISVEPIGDTIRNELTDVMNPAEIERAFGTVFSDRNEYWLIVPYTSSDYCDIAWCLHYDTGKWTRHSFADFLTVQGEYTKQTQLTIGELTGTIGEQTWRIGDRQTLVAAPMTLLSDKDGYVYQYDELSHNDNDTAIDAWFSTFDFNPTRLGTRWTSNRIDVYYTGNGLTVQYSIDKGETWTTIGTLSASLDMETPHHLFWKFDGLMCRLRFRNNTAGQHFEFSRASIFWKPSGYRL